MELDAEIDALIAGLAVRDIEWSGAEPADVPAIRAAMAAAAPPPVPGSPAVVVEDAVAQLEPGGDAVPVRIHRPAVEAPSRPGLVWIHGGGYILGSALAPDARVDRWVENLGCIVVSVDYRLAPEHPFPAPLDDCWLALRWTFAHAEELGIAPGNIGVGGGSAGGGLAAAVALRARDAGEAEPRYQLLQYPMIDDRTTSTPGREDVIWPGSANRLGWRCYLGDAAGDAECPPYGAAARAEDLSGLPPAGVFVGALDIFRDEDIAYTTRLLAAGVPAELHVYAGAPHGFDTVAPTATVSKRCRRDMEEFLARVTNAG